MSVWMMNDITKKKIPSDVEKIDTNFTEQFVSSSPLVEPLQGVEMEIVDRGVSKRRKFDVLL